MVDGDSTKVENSGTVDISTSTQVTGQNSQNVERMGSNAAKQVLDSSSTVVDPTQKDSTSPKSGDCVTAREWRQTAHLATEKTRRVHSLSTMETARAESTRTDRNTREYDSATYRKRKNAEEGSFTLTNMFPSLFGTGNALQPTTSAPLSPPRNTHSAATSAPKFKFPEIPQKPKDSRQDVVRFRSEYANKFANGSTYTVNFFSGSYEDAQREAKGTVQLLVVFIHDPSSNDSVKFIQETLNSKEFEDLVSSNQLLVWGVSNDSEEGKYVAYTLHVFKFPFISLMCPRADNRMFSARRIYGFSSASDLVQKLQKSIDLTKRDVKELREKRNKLLADRRIREEQEREYKESAERDKRRILEAKRTRQEKQEEEENQRRRNLETEARRKVIGAQREQLRLQAEEQPTSGEMVNVQVRLPSGEKFARRFSLDDSLEKLFTAIISHEKCPDFFTVASGFPRHPVHCAPEWYHLLLSEQLVADGLTPPVYHPASTFRDAGLRRAFAVFVNNCCT